jgi:hypothetical protein
LRSSVRTATRRRASTGQIILAAMLLLALLASVAPLGSLASHRCQMACCLGKAPHAEGSCSVAFMSEEKEVAANDQGEEHSAHHHTHHSEAQPSSSKDSSRNLSVAAQIITTPCAPECAAAASASTRSPRPREAAAMSVAARPRPPSAALFKKDYSKTLLPPGERRHRIRPRAPPISSINISA